MAPGPAWYILPAPPLTRKPIRLPEATVTVSFAVTGFSLHAMYEDLMGCAGELLRGWRTAVRDVLLVP